MTIRKATYGDIRAMAEVAAAAFVDEELWGVLMHPLRKEYPEDFVSFFQTKFLRQWFDSRREVLVGLDGPMGKVVAYAIWERQGVAETATGWANYLSSGVEFVSRQAVSWYIRALSYMKPNRAADAAHLDILEETFPLFAHHWDLPTRRENWSLDMLATHPDFQNRGMGSALVQWGIDRADGEKVCASVVSAEGNEGFYARFGFVEVGRANVGRLKEKGIVGGAIMFREVAAS